MSDRPRSQPAKTPEERENQLIDLAVNLAEQQLLDGTASAQVTSFYLKLGSSREKLEQDKIRNETALLRIKQDALESEKRVESLYKEAMDAFRTYSGQEPVHDEPDYD